MGVWLGVVEKNSVVVVENFAKVSFVDVELDAYMGSLMTYFYD